MKKKIKNVKLLIYIGIACLVLAIVGIIFLIPHDKKLDKNFSLAQEKIKLNDKDKQVSFDLKIKNTTGKDQHLEGITINILNKEGVSVFVYYKNIDETVKKGESYKLNVDGSIENSNLKSKKDIKEITYELE